MTDDAGCGVCGAPNETVIHALRDCRIAKDVWLQLILPEDIHKFFALDMEEWLPMNLSENNFKTVQGTGVGISSP